ncbi:hypothetical protein ACFQ2T_03090 [Methylophilus flavus]|uniref:Uncharacterized protein n=1 Tax=Methylophilus flavus TaxID=640084 RepID=A0ABW3PBU2_9PROT
MAFSSIQTNVAAMINKAYSADASTMANSAATGSTSAAGNSKAVDGNKKEAAAGTAKDNPAGASAEVTLGQSGNTTEIYTAQGLLQQMRQIQLSNTMLLFGNDEESNEDSSGLLGMMSGDSDADRASEDWTDAISQNPGQAAVMVEKAKNASIKTMLGG